MRVVIDKYGLSSSYQKKNVMCKRIRLTISHYLHHVKSLLSTRIFTRTSKFWAEAECS